VADDDRVDPTRFPWDKIVRKHSFERFLDDRELEHQHGGQVHRHAWKPGDKHRHGGK
jgi:hypothetical protein